MPDILFWLVGQIQQLFSLCRDGGEEQHGNPVSRDSRPAFPGLTCADGCPLKLTVANPLLQLFRHSAEVWHLQIPDEHLPTPYRSVLLRAQLPSQHFVTGKLQTSG